MQTPTFSVSLLDPADADALEGIALAALSLDIRNLTAEQREQGGFLTLPSDFGAHTVKRMVTLPSVVARDSGGTIVAFMLASEPVEPAPSAVIQGMNHAYMKRAAPGEPWASYGPIGVAAAAQGQGLAPRMFSLLEAALSQAGKSVMVGFVSQRNRPSLALHTRKLGFEAATSFDVAGEGYALIVRRIEATRP